MAIPLKADANMVIEESIVKNMNIFVPLGSLIYDSGTITIAEDYSNIGFNINYAPLKYIVNDENTLFATYDGNLYTNDYSKLLHLKSDNIESDYSTLKINNNIDEISEQYYDYVLEAIEKNKLVIDNDDNTLHLQNEILYSLKNEKILASNNHSDLIIYENVKAISDNVLDDLYFNPDFVNVKFNLSGDNEYFEEDNGYIYINSKEKLIFGPNKRAYLYIPKETKEIDERLFAKFNKYLVEVDSSNEHFEMYQGNLYTKGRERLLAVCNNYEDIKETFSISGQVYENESGELLNKMEFISNNDVHTATVSGDYVVIATETKEITKQAIENMIEREIVVEAENEYFELYEDNLYSKGKEKLIAIGNIKKNNEDFYTKGATLYYQVNNKEVYYTDAKIGKIITLPKELKEIDEKILSILERPNENILDFYREYEVEEGNLYFASFDGCLYNNDLTKMLLARGGSKFSQYFSGTIFIKIPNENIEYSDSIEDYDYYYEFQYEK